MKTTYDHQPQVLEAVGNGSHRYHYDIEEVSVIDPETKLTHTEWTCQEATAWEPLTANAITEAVIADRWDANYEQKLINEYNATLLGVVTDKAESAKRKQAYTDFLTERARIKAQVDQACKLLGVS